MAKRRRKRIRYFAGGGVVVCLLLYLGDQNGWFQRLGVLTTGTEFHKNSPLGSIAGDRPRGVVERGQRIDRGQTDEVRLAGGPAEVEGQTPPDAVTADNASKPPNSELKQPPKQPPKERSTGRPAAGALTRRQPLAEPKSSETTRLDAALGMVDQLEYALRRENLAELVRLQDGLLKQPLVVPAKLESRWQELQGRVEKALACGPRLRELLRRGQVLEARAILSPLRDAKTPSWMRQELDQAALDNGWPALGRSYAVVNASAKASDPLDKHREIRFLQNGRIKSGRVWNTKGRRLTVRVAGDAGFTYPSFDRGDVEPVDPTPDEALRQGLAAVEKKDVVNLLLWCCYLHEVGAKASSERLRKLLR